MWLVEAHVCIMLKQALLRHINTHRMAAATKDEVIFMMSEVIDDAM